MKKLLLGTALLFSGLTYSQVPDNGILTQNVIVTDINGVEHNFYDILDQNKAIVLDLFAEWCGPCWNYHNPNSTHPNAGALKDLETQYGSSGSGELVVLGVDSHQGGTEAELEGGQGTNGWDWVTGTPYPLAVQTIGGVFNQTYYPTIVVICPDRTVTEIGQQSVANLYAAATQCGDASTATNDSRVLDYLGDVESCGDVSLDIVIQNLGSDNLTSATIRAMVGGAEVATTNWTGNLVQYDVADVNIGSITLTQDETVTIEITDTDEDINNNTMPVNLTFVNDPYLGDVTVSILLDDYPDETTWELLDDNGAVLGSGGPYAASQGNTTVQEVVSIPATGCHSFVIYDDYGDGLNAAQWGGTDGNYTITDGGGTTIAQGGGTANWEDDKTTFNVTETASLTDLNAFKNTIAIYPNPTSNIATLSFDNNETKETSVSVINSVGQEVVNFNLGAVSGLQNVEIDASSLEAGVYLVKISSGNDVTTKRLSVTH